MDPFQRRFFFFGNSDDFQLARQRALKGPGGVGDGTHATTFNRSVLGNSEVEAQKVETFGF